MVLEVYPSQKYSNDSITPVSKLTWKHTSKDTQTNKVTDKYQYNLSDKWEV